MKIALGEIGMTVMPVSDVRGGVFTPDLIEEYLGYKRLNEVDAVALRPHPYEFALYYDC